MVQVLGRRPVTAEALVQYQTSPPGICGEHMSLEQTFTQVFLHCSVRIIPPTLRIHSFFHSSPTMYSLSNLQRS
jgi:hypothetical protein